MNPVRPANARTERWATGTGQRTRPVRTAKIALDATKQAKLSLAVWVWARPTSAYAPLLGPRDVLGPRCFAETRAIHGPNFHLIRSAIRSSSA